MNTTGGYVIVNVDKEKIDGLYAKLSRSAGKQVLLSVGTNDMNISTFATQSKENTDIILISAPVYINSSYVIVQVTIAEQDTISIETKVLTVTA